MKISMKRMFLLLGLLLVVVALIVVSARIYFSILLPKWQREEIMLTVEILADSQTPISGDIMILGEKYGSYYKDVLGKHEELVPSEEASIERGIIAYGSKNKNQNTRNSLEFVYYFNNSGTLIGGKTLQYSYAAIANSLLQAWGKGTKPYKYGDYHIYVLENNGRIYFITDSQYRNSASLIVIGKEDAIYLISHLFGKYLF